jgi:hypothetical protein
MRDGMAAEEEWPQMNARMPAILALGAVLATAAAQAGKPPTSGDADRDWQRRSTAPGVVIAVGFDDIGDWAKYNHDRDKCNPAYQVSVDARKAGCRANAFDTAEHASGKGSVRFDIPSNSGQGVGGNITIPFGDYDKDQFGENSEFWVSWRQRMTPYFFEHAYQAIGKGTTAFKQVILAEGDIPPDVEGYACSENQIVVVSSRGQNPHPTTYMECIKYANFAEGRTATNGLRTGEFTRQNARVDAKGRNTCIYYSGDKVPARDRSGCLAYRANQWTTYTMHVKTGPVGTAVSSSTGTEQPGFVNSTYELWIAYEGEDYQLAHRQENLVIPRGQYYVGGDPALKSSYKPNSGFVPGDGHPKAKFGKLWLLPYMTNKSKDEATEAASTWYDEVIVSRCPIPAPGFDAPACK